MKFRIIMFFIISISYCLVDAQETLLIDCVDSTIYELESTTEIYAMASKPSENMLAFGSNTGLAIYSTLPIEHLFDLPIELETKTLLIKVDEISWSPDGNFIAADLILAKPDEWGELSIRPTIYIWNVITQEIEITFSVAEEPYSNEAVLKWSPNGNWLAGIIGRSGQLRVWDIRNQSLAFEYQEYSETDFLGKLEWSSNSTELIFANDANVRNGISQSVSVQVFDAINDWNHIRTIDMPFWELKDMSYSPQGKLAIGGGAIFIFDTQNWELIMEIFEAEHNHHSIIWSYDGYYLLASGHYEGSNGIIIYETTDYSYRVFAGFPLSIDQIEASVDLQYIYTFGLEGNSVTGYYEYRVFILDNANECLLSVVQPDESNND